LIDVGAPLTGPNLGGDVQEHKLFVGQIPRAYDMDEIRPHFEPYGTVTEVIVIKDKASGEHRGCAFVKFATKEEADAAIAGLHGQTTLPGMSNPIQVKFANQQGASVNSQPFQKLFVGMVPPSLGAEELQEVFEPYGTVVETFIIKDNVTGSSKGCAFIKYQDKASADNAILQLNGRKQIEGGKAPLVVKYADNKRTETPNWGSPQGFGGAAQASHYGGAGGYGNGFGSGYDAYGMSPQPQQGFGQGYGAQPQAYMGYGGLETQAQEQYNMGSTQSPGGFGQSPSGFGQSPGGYGQAQQHGYGQQSGNVGRPTDTVGPQGSNLFIFNIPAEFSNEDLAVAFNPFGQVISSKVFVDKLTGESKGFGFVSYDNPTSAANAIQAMNGFQIGEKRLKVELKKARGGGYATPY